MEIRGDSQLKYAYDKEGKAIEHYEEFFTPWKDANPGIAEVENTKKRLAGLKSK